MAEVKDYPPYLDYPKPRKKQSNADRIRGMTDKELAAFLAKHGVSGSNLRMIGIGYTPTATELKVLFEGLYATWMRWLVSPVEDE